MSLRSPNSAPKTGRNVLLNHSDITRQSFPELAVEPVESVNFDPRSINLKLKMTGSIDDSRF